CWKQVIHSHLRKPIFRPGVLTLPVLHYRACSYASLLHRKGRTPGRFNRWLSSGASQASTSKSRAIVLTSPTESELEEVEIEIDLIPEEQIYLVLTDRAAEQLRTISVREGNPHAALRISVESGGCHGYQYKMALAAQRVPGDYHLMHPEIRPSNVYIDAVSLPMINGSTIDFATELIGSSFRVVGNPQAKGGCGCGVSWEMKE
ncbi:hypothetical protein ID866_2337, partial [Astraeus odoratus]